MKDFLKRLVAFEPVQMRALLVALGVVATAFGAEWLTPWFDRVDVSWAALFAVFPLIQGLLTRPAVTPNVKVEALAEVPTRRH